MALVTHFTVRRQREEMQQVEALEELVQLRRWPEAAAAVRGHALASRRARRRRGCRR